MRSKKYILSLFLRNYNKKFTYSDFFDECELINSKLNFSIDVCRILIGEKNQNASI
jgi:hypothetical protein